MKTSKLLIAAGLLGLSFSVNAATITYNLTVSNALPDGANYATVVLTDNALTDNVDVTVQVNDLFFDGSDNKNFGMQVFAFNYDVSGLTLTDPLAPTIINAVPDWKITNDANNSEFGTFNFDLSGTGNSRTDLLTFSITGVEGDTVENYAVANANGWFAAAHIAGFDATADCDGCTSAWFAGNDDGRGITPPAVPVPPAVWLFGSGLLGLVGVARRKPME